MVVVVVMLMTVVLRVGIVIVVVFVVGCGLMRCVGVSMLLIRVLVDVKLFRDR
jgi:hypothetical protein